MGHIDEVKLAHLVSDSLRLPVSARQIGNSQAIEMRLSGLDRPNGLSVTVSVGLRLVFAEVSWDTFAERLLRSALSAESAAWLQVNQLQLALANAGITSTVEIDRNAKEDLTPASIHTAKSLTIEARSVAWRPNVAESAADVAIAVFAVLIALLPLDHESAGLIVEDEYDVEGGRQQVTKFRYERSRSNRAVAILIHGTRCKVCEVDFGERYQDIGSGYIEVHHLLPLHLMSSPGVVDPTADLVPLCANCHRMAHRVDPPHSPDVLRGSLRKSPKEEN